MKIWWKLYFIVVVTLIAGVLAYPREERIFEVLGFDQQLQITRGLDLQGGAHLVFEAEFAEGEDIDKNEVINNLSEVIERRVNPAGTAGVTVQPSGDNRLIIELPGIDDINQAIELIGQTAELSFIEITPDQQINFTGLTGADFKRATPDLNPNSAQPVINFEFNGDAAETFSVLTTRLFQTGGQLLITLDGQTLFNGGVSSPITDGVGTMTGFTSIEDARDTANLLNAGALPVPIELVEQRSIGPTLGQESIDASVVAALVGLGLIALFLVAFYRIGGLLAVYALMLYMLITLAIYKLSIFTPVTVVLTLAGIAGFILSIGVATDGAILILERIKEELRKGDKPRIALPRSYDRAWITIRDANLATFLSCIILYQFGAALIKGFAVTLGIGVLLNLVIARFVLRIIIERMSISPRVNASWFEPIFTFKGGKK